MIIFAAVYVLMNIHTPLSLYRGVVQFLNCAISQVRSGGPGFIYTGHVLHFLSLNLEELIEAHNKVH